MTHAWNQTIHIDETIAKELIESQHRIIITSISLLDEGWDNVVYLVNHHLVFRFPRREEGFVCMQNEIAILPYIKTQLTFALTAPQWTGQSSDVFPYPYAGYEMISGAPLCDAAKELVDDTRFAVTLASWLNKLHAIPIKPEHAELIQDSYDWKVNVPHRTARCEDNLKRYESYFAEAGLHKADLVNTIAHLKTWQFTPKKRAYVHGDLYSRHIMVHPTNLTLTGIIDWGDIHIGHPGIDLASGMVLTESVLNVFLETYGPIDNETKCIMPFHAFCHGMSFLPYAFEQNKENLKRWATMVLVRAMNEIGKIE